MNNQNLTRGIFYFHPEGEPFFNMAFDNWLFDKLQNNPKYNRAILRLYSWRQKAITIGYNQDYRRAIDQNMIAPDMPIIRRITGGRTICHDSTELTFTLAADLDIFAEQSRSLKKTIKLISRSIIEILNSVNIESAWMAKSDRSFSMPLNRQRKACFDSFSRYEIFTEGNKIVAGAQRRRGNFFIHQGSIKVNGICSCPAIGQEELTVKYTGNDGPINSYKYTIYEFIDIFRTVFSRNIGLRFDPGEVSASSRYEIDVLAGILNEKMIGELAKNY